MGNTQSIDSDLPGKVSTVLGALQKEGKIDAQIRPYVQKYLEGQPVVVENVPRKDSELNAFGRAVTQGLEALQANDHSLGIYRDQAGVTYYVRQDLDGWKQRVESNVPVTPLENPAIADAKQQVSNLVAEGMMTPQEARFAGHADDYGKFVEEIDQKTGGSLKRVLENLRGALNSTDPEKAMNGMILRNGLDLIRLKSALASDPQAQQVVSDALNDSGLAEKLNMDALPIKLPSPTSENMEPAVVERYRATSTSGRGR